MDLRAGIISTAQSLGIDPYDLATAISYETAGSFDPTKRGPITQWGQHRGLIQFGEPQAREYGVDWNDPVGSQLGPNGAVAKYLRSTGVKPGMGLLDVYSAINAGGVGRYGASDANNGGAPGTVRDKVEKQMAGHRANAEKLLGGGLTVASAGQSQVMGNPGGDTMQPVTKERAHLLFPNMDADRRDRLIMAMEGMTLNPNQALIEAAKGGIETRRDAARTQGQINRTVEYLRRVSPELADAVATGSVDPGAAVNQAFQMQAAQQQQQQDATRRQEAARLLDGARPDLARAVVAGVVDPEKAFELSQKGEDLPASVKEYEYARRQGFGGTFQDFQTEKARAGATNVTVGEGSSFYKKLDEGQAATFTTLIEQGLQAQQSLPRIEQLGALLEATPTGATAALKQKAGEWGINTEGLSDIQAAEALINQLVPEQRAPGSGTMSDRDVELFKSSLPRLINTPDGNRKIVAIMRGMAKYQAQQGEIAMAVANRQMTPEQGRAALMALPNPLEGFTAPGGTPTAPTAPKRLKFNPATGALE